MIITIPVYKTKLENTYEIIKLLDKQFSKNGYRVSYGEIYDPNNPSINNQYISKISHYVRKIIDEGTIFIEIEVSDTYSGKYVKELINDGFPIFSIVTTHKNNVKFDLIFDPGEYTKLYSISYYREMKLEELGIK